MRAEVIGKGLTYPFLLLVDDLDVLNHATTDGWVIEELCARLLEIPLLNVTARSTATTCSFAFGNAFMKLTKVGDSASTTPSGQLQRTTPRGSPSASDTTASACSTSITTMRQRS